MNPVLTSCLAAVLAGVALSWLFPGLLRPVWWVLVRILYRFSVYGRERIPASGGHLIVCNHVSYVDWLVLWAACPRRLTFVLWSGYHRNPLLRFVLSWVRGRAVAIDERTDHPHAVAESLQKVADALDAGQAVLMFPEGRLTRSGHLLPFGRGVEMVLRRTRTDVPVIPACTDGLWGSVFSYEGGRVFWKLPKEFRPHVAVTFGLPLSKYADSVGRAVPFLPSPLAGEGGERGAAEPPGEGNKASRVPSTGSLREPPSPARGEGEGPVVPASELRLAVQELAADCATRQSEFIPLLHRTFVRCAVRLWNLFRPCVVDNAAGEKILNWGKTFVAAMAVTRYLRRRVGDSPNVGVWLPTGLGSALANLAIAFLGRASVNLNYTAGADPLRSAARQAGLRLVVTSKRFLLRFPLDLPDDVERVYLEDVLASATKWEQIRTFLMAVLLPGWFIDRFVLGLHRHRPDDTLTIVFSSGSTGEPKGVVLTHRNVASNVDSAIRTISIRRSDVLLGVLPFFHSFGYTVCLWAPLVASAKAVYHPDPRAAKEVGVLTKKHAVTLFISTATFLRFYIRRCNPDDFRSLRILICGAEKLPVKLQDEFREKFGMLPLEGYGCTELSPVVSTNLPDLPGQTLNTRGTVGQPIIGVCVRAFTAEGREPLPTGVEGVLCGKGPNVMGGYLNQPHKTNEAVREGWYFTGDVGLVQPDGFIKITGRVSRFAKIAGEMIPLERVEEELHDAYGGGDRVLAVAAVPDERRGERLVVLYLAEADTRMFGLLEALPGRGLPNLWVPDARDCHRVDALPLLGSGKLDLKRVGELAKELASNV
jgi:acyl-[acyl-carrier-protein]-phospholipid O-acyltransferase/long-chain-fatty-acid--[acyl-carrier-protein] ligase